MPMSTAITEEFPGAVAADRFVSDTRELLAPHGFDADNTIACLGACRDELARPLASLVVRAWGEAFNFSSLAGLLTLGRTGFAAARGHAPRAGGRERFVFITTPHIGVDAGGTVGRVQRPGQEQPTAACGALVALAEELSAGGLRTELDVDDVEQSLLRRRLEPLLKEPAPGIAEITRVARRAILEDLERLIAAADMSDVDYAVFSGVQIHTPERELVWPADAYVVTGGRRVELA